MAQRNIDFGTFPNDPDADAIRTAFQKTQENFTELFAGLQDQAVLSVNKTPGAGITVFPVTGNVVVSADIACVRMSTTTLSLGINANGNASATMDNSATQIIYIDLPANITGISNATFSGVVTSNTLAANLSITSGNTITATGNITGGNLSTAGVLTVTGNANVGNIGAVTGVFVSNVSAANLNATTANITGNISGNNLSISNIANINGNLNANGNIYTPNYYLGNGFYLTDVVAAPGNIILNANSNVSIPSSNSDVFISVAGTANVVQVSQTGANITGTLGISGNANAGNIGAGIGVFTGNVTATNVYANSGTIGAQTLKGEGGNISNIQGGNVSGTVGSATTAGTVTTNAQPNITSVGTLSSVDVTGNVTAGNVYANSGTIGATTLKGEGGNISNIQGGNVSGTVASATSATTAGTVTTNSQPNITSVGTLSSLDVTGNTIAGNVYANSGTVGALLLTGTLTTNAQPNITSVGTLSNASVTGNVTAGNVYANSGIIGAQTLIGEGGNISNIQGANVSGTVANATYATSAGSAGSATTAGTVTTAAQPNITSVGTLTGLSVNGNITAANITANTGVFTGNGAGLTNIAGANVTGTVANATYALDAGNATNATSATSATTAGTVTTAAQPNITSVGTLTGLGVNGNITAANITANTGVFTGNGSGLSAIAGANVTGTVANATYALDAGNATNATSATSATTAGTVTTAAQPNITSVGTLSSLNVSANITSGNVYANSGTIGALSLAGTLTTAAQPNITSTGTLTGLDVNGNITAANITANTGVFTGNAAGLTNIPGANVSGTVASATTAGTVTTASQPNITSVGTLSSLSVTANISAGNANLGNLVTANFFSGDGSLLTNISVGAGSYIENGNSEVRVDANSNVRVNVSGTSNVLVISSTGANITGTANVSGNLSAGNISATLLTGTVNTASQPNITSLGTLTGLNVNGISNLGPNSNVIITGGSNNQFLLSDGSGGVKWVTPANTTVAPGSNTQVLFNDVGSFGANANLTFNKSTGTLTSQALSVTNSGTFGNVYANSGTVGASLLSGTLTTAAQPNITSVGSLASLIVSGNVNAGNVSGGNLISANFVAGTLTTAAQPNITSVGTLTGLSVNGNITAANITANTGVFTGNGSGLSAIAGANVTGTVANATFATSAGSATTAGTVTTNAQPNITSTGTLTGLTVNGLVTASRSVINNGITTSNIHALTVLQTWNNSSVQFSAIEANITDTNSAANSLLLDLQISNVSKFAVSKEGNIFYSGVITGNGSGLSAIAGANVTGTVANATFATSAGSATSATTATTAGTVTTAAQPNITSTGTLTSLSVSGNIAAQANVNMTGYVIRSVNAAVSAAGTAQGNATAITKEINVVSTVASGAGVVLPTAVAGMVITITNTSANSLLVYPAANGIINSQSANAAYTHPASATLQYVAPTTTQWYTVGATFA